MCGRKKGARRDPLSPMSSTITWGSPMTSSLGLLRNDTLALHPTVSHAQEAG